MKNIVEMEREERIAFVINYLGFLPNAYLIYSARLLDSGSRVIIYCPPFPLSLAGISESRQAALHVMMEMAEAKVPPIAWSRLGECHPVDQNSYFRLESPDKTDT